MGRMMQCIAHPTERNVEILENKFITDTINYNTVAFLAKIRLICKHFAIFSGGFWRSLSINHKPCYKGLLLILENK